MNLSDQPRYPEGPLPQLTLPVGRADRYVRVMDVRTPPGHPDVQATPVDLAKLSRYAWYALTFFNDEWIAKVVANDLREGGHNTVTFYKHGDDLWSYRRSTWTSGPYSVPVGGAPLDDVLAKLNDIRPERWVAFCERHPLPDPAAAVVTLDEEVAAIVETMFDPDVPSDHEAIAGQWIDAVTDAHPLAVRVADVVIATKGAQAADELADLEAQMTALARVDNAENIPQLQARLDDLEAVARPLRRRDAVSVALVAKALTRAS